MRYFSMFSGIGGFELAIKYATGNNIRSNELASSKGSKKQHSTKNKLKQWQCVGYSEIDKYACQIYDKHFNHKNYGDCTKINGKELPDFELLVGGFPCQAFSIAGKRGGFSDTRGTLFFDIARIVREKQPRLLLLENVKGLLSHDKGQTFYTIISTLDELGYDCQWQVLNSKDFGVPQNRERVFIIGHLRGTSRPEVFPVGGEHKENKGKVAATIMAKDYKGIGNQEMTIVRQPLKFLERNQKNVEGDYSYTLDSANTGGIRVNDKIRRLTPTECERLQGFPDGWTEGLSDTQRYKTLGNAVTVNVIEYLASKLIKN